MDKREYVCNQMYKQHDLLRKDSWTDADKLEYMELNIAPYSRYWRMGMKKALKHAIRLLREEEAKADRKTEPQYDAEEVAKDINRRVDLIKREWEVRHTETNVETMSCAECIHRPIGAEICEEPCHYAPKDEPQTERSE